MPFDQKKQATEEAPIDPLAIIATEQAHMASLCDALETIADTIPHRLNLSLIDTVAQDLRKTFARLHWHEEHLLFPLLSKRALPEDEIDKAITGFRHENAMDEGYALEVLSLLDHLGKGKKPDNLDTAGYLLRSFFESVRRHLRWEDFILIKLARRRLLDEDLAIMADQISQEGS